MEAAVDGRANHCRRTRAHIVQQQSQHGRQVLYAGIGASLVQYDVDVVNLSLARRETVALPAGAQYAWQHVSKKYLYVAASNTGPGAATAAAADPHYVCAFRVDAATGALEPHGEPLRLRQRPIHLSTDRDSQHVLIAYCNPSAVSVHRIESDGTIGSEVRQPPLDAGIFAHQIRTTPSNSTAILVTRGFNATAAKGEDPGALKVFNYRNGVLSDEVSIAPNGGYGFGPRHLDFHPSRPWIYVSLERQNKVQLFRLRGDVLEESPAFSVDTLRVAGGHRPRQWAGAIHVHPNGRFVYGCERSTHEIPGRTEEAYIDGENTIVVYAVNPDSGELTAIQHIDTRAPHPRTFSVDATGRMLIAAAKSPVIDRTQGNRYIPASLDVFAIGDDGKLTYVRKYDVDVGSASMFWSGLIECPA